METHGDRKTYTTPEIKEFGSVVDLTEVGNTNPGTDFCLGSVNPPGDPEPPNCPRT